MILFFVNNGDFFRDSLFIKNFPHIDIAGLLADREFANGPLFAWLKQQRVNFYIRIKEGSVLRIKKKKLITAKKLFKTVTAKHMLLPMLSPLLPSLFICAAGK